jgi:hypothetical protein
VYFAFGWLTFAATMHFLIDVLAQYLRHKRVPGPETTLYYGLNTAYALGQVLFGVLGLLIARRAIVILREWPALLLCGVAAAAWFVIGVLFIEYPQPRFMVVIFGILVLAMTLTRRARLWHD